MASTNELDMLMDTDPLELTKEDIDSIIAYHRNNRARENAAGKMEKPKIAKGSVDLASLIQGMVKKEGGEAAPAPKPSTGGIRRV